MISSGPIEDRLAIRELVESYNDAVMRIDGAAWAENWTEDAVWSVRGEEVRGRERILARWTEAMSVVAFIDFFSSGGPVVVTGDTARGTWYQQERLYSKAGKKRGATGVYHDEYVKKNGRWYFQKRVFTILDMREQPAPEGNGGAAGPQTSQK